MSALKQSPPVAIETVQTTILFIFWREGGE